MDKFRIFTAIFVYECVTYSKLYLFMRRPEIVERIRDTLRRVAPDAQGILFGSEARGDARFDSDIDLLILVDKEKITLDIRQAVTYPLYDIEFDTGVLINPIVLSKRLWGKLVTPFYENVTREGILL